MPRNAEKPPATTALSGKTSPQTVPSGRPTLKTIAYMTGLGVTTVSRALNDAPDIGQATKERVRLVAKQIGYRPNRAGVRLRTGKTNVISLLIHVDNEVLSLSTHLVYGISEYLAATRYHLIVTPYTLTEDPLNPVRYIVESGSADGMILSRIEPQDPRLIYLRAQGMPFVTHGRSELDFEHPFVDFDNAAYAELAVERLVARGRRRISLLPPPVHLTYSRHMQEGFVRGILRHDLTEVPLHSVTTDSRDTAIMREVGQLMSLRGRPDGIVCGSASAAIAAIMAAEEEGLVLGRDFDLAVKESFGLMAKFRRETIVVNEDFRAAGRGLGEAMLRCVDGKDLRSLQTLIRP
jgi:LacI family transcriptional regulator